jgi:protein-disulfide isomerase
MSKTQFVEMQHFKKWYSSKQQQIKREKEWEPKEREKLKQVVKKNFIKLSFSSCSK